MNTVIGVVAAAALLLGGAAGVRAADASHPYSNINRAVDAGNNTGNSQTDQLNQQELQKVSPDGSGSGTARSGRGYGQRGGANFQQGHRPYGYGAPGWRPGPYGYVPGPYAYGAYWGPRPAYVYAAPGAYWRPYPFWVRPAWVGWRYGPYRRW